MKRLVGIVGIILSIVVAGIFLINVQKEDTDVTKKQTKVGVIMIGSYDDKSYNQTHYEAMDKVAQKLNLNVTYKENVETDEKSKEIMEDLIADGCEIIICNSFDYGEWIAKAAEENPDVFFFHATGTKNSKNLASFFGRIYQMRYISGIVAGLQTETDKIGYVAAFPIPEVNRGINAFTLGVKSVNPNAQVYVNWCNSWGDDTAAESATEELISSYDIDVLAMHTDSLKPLEIAEKTGIWSVGYNIDNSELYPKTFLTAPVWQWENYYEPYILKCLQGKFKGENYWEGTSTGVVGLAPLTDNVKKGTAEIVESEKKRLTDGFFDVFYGPIRDKDGVLRVEDGTNMADETLLNDFKWYVEGVVIHEK